LGDFASHGTIIREERICGTNAFDLALEAKPQTRYVNGPASGCPATVALASRRVDDLSVPLAPARGLGGRSAAAHGVAQILRDDEAALAGAGFKKRCLVLRRRFRDPQVVHRSKLGRK
jgi:hypothetical protein